MRILVLAAAGAAVLAGCSRAPQPDSQTAAAAPAAAAQSSAQAGPRRGEPQTLDEMMERALARFDRADANADGKVTRDELQALRPIAPPGGRGRGGFGGGLARADANGDGVITRDEVENQTRARFERLDADKDGQVTREEMRAGFGGAPAPGAQPPP